MGTRLLRGAGEIDRVSGDNNSDRDKVTVFTEYKFKFNLVT